MTEPAHVVVKPAAGPARWPKPALPELPAVAAVEVVPPLHSVTVAAPLAPPSATPEPAAVSAHAAAEAALRYGL